MSLTASCRHQRIGELLLVVASFFLDILAAEDNLNRTCTDRETHQTNKHDQRAENEGDG